MGGTSSNSVYSNPNQSANAGESTDMISQFASSSQASGYTPEQIQALATARLDAATGQYIGPGDVNVTGLMQAFNSWQQGAGGSAQSQSLYAQAVSNQPGRDATILTGAQVNPNTLLPGTATGMYSAPGVPSRTPGSAASGGKTF